MALPKDMKYLIGKSEIRRSLKTRLVREARLKASRLANGLYEVFEAVRDSMSNKLTPEVIRYIVESYIKRQLDNYEAYRLEHEGPIPLDRASVMGHESDWSKLKREFTKHVERGKLDEVDDLAQDYVSEFGVEADKSSLEYKSLQKELLKARVKWVSIEDKRSHGDYSDTDSGLSFLTQTASSGIPTQPVPPVGLGSIPQPSNHILLSDAVEKYIATKTESGAWRKSTIKDIPPHLREFARVIGGVPVSELSRDHMRFYRQYISSRPARMSSKELTKATPQQIVDRNVPPDKRLQPKSIDNRFVNVRGFLNWCEEEEYTYKARNLNAILKLEKAQKKEMKSSGRTHFSLDDLKSLLKSPAYAQDSHGAASRHWVPLIALHTGARIEEICQLTLSDICQKDGVWVFDINDRDGKGLKSEAGERLIPIHQTLIDIGLLERVKYLKAKKHSRLFPELQTRKSTEKYSDRVSTWFTRYRRECGVTGLGKVFHSFRHTFITECLRNGVSRNLYKEVVGHQKGDASDVTALYEHGYRIETLRDEVVAKVDFSEALDVPTLRASRWVKSIK